MAIDNETPTAQAGSGEGLKVENSHTFDRMLVCCHCNKSAEEVGILSNCAARIPPASAAYIAAAKVRHGVFASNNTVRTQEPAHAKR